MRGSHNPGAGGWPTIRYFNKDTGVAGAPYVKKTSGAMCEELGNIDYMQAYVEEYAHTSLCSVASGAGCSEREKGYIAKMKDKSVDDLQKQFTRLESLKGDSMKPELKEWVTKRHAILKQLLASGGSDEL